MIKKFLVPLIFLASLSCKKPSSSPGLTPPVVVRDTTFNNPVLANGPDPWVIQKDSFYYYTNTSGDRIRLWRTKNMSQLKNAVDQIIWLRPTSGPNIHNIWAPEVHFLDGKWYAYYTAGSTPNLGTQRTFVLENTSPDPFKGSWIDKGKIADTAADYFAIDATVLEHNNNKYLIWSGHASPADNTQRLYIAQMENPWTLASSRIAISSPQYQWESFGSSPVGNVPSVNEGPEILKNGAGKVFLIYSASGCWTDDYCLGMMTLKDGGDPLKPSDWLKTPQPVFVKKPESLAFGPGHNAFFKSPDNQEDWIIYHANAFTGQGCADNRSPRIQKFTWNSDGTPNFGQPVSLTSKIPRPSGEKE